MERLKRCVKIIGLIGMVFLASIGIGITGAAPINLEKKTRKRKNETKIELVEKREDQTSDVEIVKIG